MIVKLNKKTILYSLIGLLILACVVVFIINIIVKKNYICTFDTNLINGMNESDVLKIHTKNKEITSLDLTQEISMSTYYHSLGTYYESLNKLLSATYEDLDANIKIDKDNMKVIANVSTSKKGIVLNNITIKQNGKDDTTLRYDGNNNLKSENAIKVGSIINLGMLKKAGYKCN